MGFTLNLGRRGPQTRPSWYLVVDPTDPRGFHLTQIASAATWFPTIADAQQFARDTPACGNSFVAGYFKRVPVVPFP